MNMSPHQAARSLVRSSSNPAAPASTTGMVAGPASAPEYSPFVGLTTLLGNVGGGVYAYRKTGGFWWTVLGVVVGGAAGNLTGRVLTTPIR